MDRLMMDQFMFCKTNIIFCGPANEWMKRKKSINEKKNVNVKQKRFDLIEFQRVYRSSRSNDVLLFCFLLYFLQRNALTLLKLHDSRAIF